MKQIKIGDKVVVISGKSKGKQGLVMEILRDKGRILVEGVNMVTRHVKPKRQGDKGGIVQEEASIHISNVMPLDSSSKPCRISKIKR